jgi:Tfp pilus assembly protein FimT
MDTLATLAVAGTLAGIAVPIVTNAFENQRLGIEVRNVERELQSARLAAVSSNRPIIVRFNCPSTGKYRRVELIGTLTAPATDDADARAAVRCAYPYPAADRSPLTRPNNDGPTMQLYQTIAFAASEPLEFWPNGTVHVPSTQAVIGATGATITLAKGSTTKSISVNSLGKIKIN